MHRKVNEFSLFIGNLMWILMSAHVWYKQNVSHIERLYNMLFYFLVFVDCLVSRSFLLLHIDQKLHIWWAKISMKVDLFCLLLNNSQVTSSVLVFSCNTLSPSKSYLFCDRSDRKQNTWYLHYNNRIMFTTTYLDNIKEIKK